MKRSMINKVFYGIIMLLFVFKVNGQLLITGSIKDHGSNPVSNVGIHLLNTQITTFSDTAGYFSIHSLAAGKYTIELSAIGYATLATSIDVKEKDNKPFVFQLQNSLVQLEAVTVTAEKKEELLQ